RSRVAELLDLVGLTSKASVYPDQLSGGQRQRIAIARALAAKPSVLLADEPTSALDPATTDSVLAVLDRARSELGVTVLIVTHDMAVVRRIADDVAVLEDGQIVENGKVLDLVAEPGSRVSSALLPEKKDLRPSDVQQYLTDFWPRPDLPGLAVVDERLVYLDSNANPVPGAAGSGELDIVRAGQSPDGKWLAAVTRRPEGVALRIGAFGENLPELPVTGSFMSKPTWRGSSEVWT
ncbi:LpqB family beta-propeller domain-containing protein, partial [Klebsiella pneumoniae]|nr:LpqB family beta-propeller domain-containing protein [Klebsiella pneumoniae]